MTQKTRKILKSYFETNLTPDEPEFIDLIDSMLNLSESEAQTMLGPLIGPSAEFTSYNIDATTVSEFSALNLTSSNQFGSTASSNSTISLVVIVFAATLSCTPPPTAYFTDKVVSLGAIPYVLVYKKFVGSKLASIVRFK